MKHVERLLVIVLIAGAAAHLPAQTSSPSPIFRIEADEFWLNLHHFLYVLGRAQAKAPDASRAAVADAPEEAGRGVRSLNEPEQKTWAEAVTAYATGLSRRDAIFDDLLPAIAVALAAADDAPTLSGVALDADARSVLERAAPLYRKAWWPAHREANRTWQSSIEPLIERHGQAILALVTRAYGLQWPSAGYAVHVSRYANWAGAYSTRGNLLVLSSADKGTQGNNGLETIFHEGMHQWDQGVLTALLPHAKSINGAIPRDLTHAMIFFTAGYSVQRVLPGHVPVADAYGIWSLMLSGSSVPALRLKVVLDDVWKPYLDGTGTRDEALAALVAKTALR